MGKLIDIIANSIPDNAAPEIILLFLLFAFFLYALSRTNAIYDFIDRFSKRELIRLKEL